MRQVLIAAGVLGAAVVIAAVLRSRQRTAAPTQPAFAAPVQIDRADFASAAPWLVVVFSSATCHTCADVRRKAQVAASDQVAVVDVEYTERGDLHRKYHIDAVPLVVVADTEGVVRTSWIGPVSATDLWAGVAEARQPGSTPSGVVGHCQSHG